MRSPDMARHRFHICRLAFALTKLFDEGHTWPVPSCTYSRLPFCREMRFFFLWCAFVYSTRAQQASSYPTSTSNGASIPRITYTSTRSCKSRPSTIFVYTSNSSSFLLTHCGPSSATTPAESSSIPTVSGAHDAVSSGFPSTIASSRAFDGNPAISQPPFSAIPGSTCPLPSTRTSCRRRRGVGRGRCRRKSSRRETFLSREAPLNANALSMIGLPLQPRRIRRCTQCFGQDEPAGSSNMCILILFSPGKGTYP